MNTLLLRSIFVSAAAALLVGSSGAASSSQVTTTTKRSMAISGDIGTTGVGASLWITASPRFVVTLGYNALNTSFDHETDNVEYDSRWKFSNGHAMLRFYPTGGRFNVSAGAVLTDNKVDATGQPEPGSTYTFNGVTYPASLVGALTGTADWDKSVAPYFGVGWSKTPDATGWGMFVDIGAMYAGAATATLAASGPIASDPTFQENLRQEEQDLNDDLDDFKFFPVARFGVMHRF